MVFDSVKNCSLYYGLHKNFKKAFDFIVKAVKENFPTGKYEIDGANLYASIQEYLSFDFETAQSEGHRNYIDIQFIVKGTERILVEDINFAKIKTDYDPVKDIEFYFDAQDANTVILTDGDFVVLFPHDIHKPSLTYKTKEKVKKIVVKVKVQ